MEQTYRLSASSDVPALPVDVSGTSLETLISESARPFPPVNLQTDKEAWASLVSALFGPWARVFHTTIIIRIADDGKCLAWML